MPQIKITITPGTGVQSVTVHIDNIDVSYPTAVNPVSLSTGVHSLHWWFAGNSGNTLDITLDPADGGATLLKISDVIAPGFPVEAGDKTFTL